MWTKTELTLEQTQQGVSDEVLERWIVQIFKNISNDIRMVVLHGLVQFDTSAGNPVKEILFKIDLLLTGRSYGFEGDEALKSKNFKEVSVTLITKRFSRSVKVKEVQERCIIKAFKLSNQEMYEHVGPKVTSSQDGKVYKMEKRDYAWLMISRCSRSHIHIQVKIKEQALPKFNDHSPRPPQKADKDNYYIKGREWSLSNANNLSRILTCFHLASGLKVNFNKSKLFGIGVSNLEVNSFASSIGCLASHLPGSYLGLPIGAKMSRCANWKPLVERFQKRLSKWKANTLSFDGRLTLIRKFFCGNFSDVNKISWIAWDKVLSPRNKGGSRIGRLSTRGLIEDSNTSTSSGPWSRIMKLKTDLNLIGIDLPMLFKKKVGNGQNTRFWHDNWLGGVSLHAFFPRLYQLESNPNCLVCKRNIIASPHQLVSGPGRVTSSVIHPNSFQPTPVGLSFNCSWI
ncbi:hypothetical protein Tco_0467780 [Tanacetum coccineum]